MFSRRDSQYLNNPDYNMALEKFFMPDYYDTLNEYMQNDKKKMSDKLRFVLIKGMGETVILDDITADETEHAIECIIR